MKIDLRDLYHSKKEFDQRIEKEMGLIGANLLNKKIRATLIELGELLNEVPSVTKYWSKQCVPKSEKVARYYADLYQQPMKLETENPKLEEYVDVMQFLLTVGLDLGVPVDTIFTQTKKTDIESQFDELFYAIGLMIKPNHQTIAHYQYIMSLYFGLGDWLGFSVSDIIDGYLEKTAINHTRLSEGY